MTKIPVQVTRRKERKETGDNVVRKALKRWIIITKEGE